MKNKIYLHSKPSLTNIIKEIFFDFEVHSIVLDYSNCGEHINSNIIILDEHNVTKGFNESFFINNNVVVCLPKKINNPDKTKHHKTRFFYSNINVKKFFDEVKTFFDSKTVIFKNNKILDEKIINIDSGLSSLLTPLEKQILIVLIEKKQINREYILESVLKINKNAETKTIESHLTRIRKKLQSINVQVEIISKEDMVLLVF